MLSVCTREVILSLIDDVELISRELLDNCVLAKPQRFSASDHSAMTELLVDKDKKLQAALKVAAEQGEVEQEIDEVRSQVEEQDEQIKNLQKQLKEAEALLANTIYQAKQKLESISKAKPVLSEDLIKYSHKISASNAVAAPLNWQQGDPRRPYPTDIEMRGGFLSRSELPLSQQLQHLAPPQPAISTFPSPAAPPQPSPSRSGSSAQASHIQSPGRPSHFGWSASGELSMQVPGGGQVHIETAGSRQAQQDEVEVMSTDSSSPSSTDSN
jgi:mediator of RNA polymerase II transcription subunit 4